MGTAVAMLPGSAHWQSQEGCCKDFSHIFLQGGSVPQFSSQPHLCPELGQVTLRRNLLFVQAFKHAEVLSGCVFGELGYVSTEKPSRGITHHEILLKMQRDLSLFHLEVYLFIIIPVMHHYKLLGT